MFYPYLVYKKLKKKNKHLNYAVGTNNAQIGCTANSWKHTVKLLIKHTYTVQTVEGSTFCQVQDVQQSWCHLCFFQDCSSDIPDLFQCDGK